MGQAMVGLARCGEALPAWAGTPHTAPALHHGGLSSALERKPTANFPQIPFSTAEVLVQFCLLNL